MKNFVVEHSDCSGWYFNKKLNYVTIIDAHVFKTEKEFYDEADTIKGRCQYTIMKKMYKFVAIEEIEARMKANQTKTSSEK